MRTIGHHSRQGQSLVEFALLAPVVFLLLFGLFDLGDAVYTYGTLAHGTDIAATYASLHCGYNGSGYTAAQLTQQVQQNGTLLQATQLSVNASPASGSSCSQPGTAITVTSTYQYQAITPIIKPFFPNGLSIQTQSEVLAQ